MNERQRWLRGDMSKTLLTLPLAILAMGCSPKAAYEISDVEYQLAKAALSVEDSLRTLAATQQIHAKNAINTDILITPQGGMGGLASIDWSGPIEPLLERIGEMTRYRVKVLGPIPHIPVIVSISARERMVADILKDAGLQTGKRANLVVYPTSRIIELRYTAIA
jgi:defect-in-organelle-trafficking protein DotD